MLIRFAQEHDLVFCETSAKTGENVEEAFLKCSKTILAKIETGELDPGIKFTKILISQYYFFKVLYFFLISRKFF